MSAYQQEQFETLNMIRKRLSCLPAPEIAKLKAMISDYLEFRRETEIFLKDRFGELCTIQCYQNDLSACCSRDGIITFFADMIINILMSDAEEISRLLEVLTRPDYGFKCVYLGENGCLWKIKPIVCEMFLCDSAQDTVFEQYPEYKEEWERLKQHQKSFTWPDRPVLFDILEEYFLDLGCSSPLMYLHNSPGLLKIKLDSQREIDKTNHQ